MSDCEWFYDDADVGFCNGCNMENPLINGFCQECTEIDREVEKMGAAYEDWKERRWR